MTYSGSCITIGKVAGSSSWLRNINLQSIIVDLMALTDQKVFSIIIVKGQMMTYSGSCITIVKVAGSSSWLRNINLRSIIVDLMALTGQKVFSIIIVKGQMMTYSGSCITIVKVAGSSSWLRNINLQSIIVDLMALTDQKVFSIIIVKGQILMNYSGSCITIGKVAGSSSWLRNINLRSIIVDLMALTDQKVFSIIIVKGQMMTYSGSCITIGKVAGSSSWLRNINLQSIIVDLMALTDQKVFSIIIVKGQMMTYSGSCITIGKVAGSSSWLRNINLQSIIVDLMALTDQKVFSIIIVKGQMMTYSGSCITIVKVAGSSSWLRNINLRSIIVDLMALTGQKVFSIIIVKGQMMTYSGSCITIVKVAGSSSWLRNINLRSIIVDLMALTDQKVFSIIIVKGQILMNYSGSCITIGKVAGSSSWLRNINLRSIIVDLMALTDQKDESMEVNEAGSKFHAAWNPKQGGFRAAMFVFAFAGFENMGFIANMASLVLYFSGVMHFDLSDSATTLTNFMGATFLLTIIGGFISDTYMTRLNTILMFGLIEIWGYILLTLQARYRSLQPDQNCLTCHLKGGNAWMFYITLCLLALGCGGIRGCVPALGADQFDKNHPKERKHLTSYFNWLLLSVTSGATLGVTVIVWVYTEKSWSMGYFISMLLALVGFIFITLGKPFYRVRFAGEGPLLRILQVIELAIRNRKLSLPENSNQLFEINEKESEFVEDKIPHSNQFRFLDKAAVLPKGTTTEPLKVCSVTQVEEVKILVRMLPILASTILMNTCLAQLQTFSVQQGNIMDLHLGSFKVPAASIPVIPLFFMSLLIPVYELSFIPLARRITGHPSGITHLQRVGVGLVLSIVSMAVAAVVEVKRRNAFNHHLKQISLFWLSFQYGIFGIADMFTLVGLMEFFYSEAPAGMRSLSTSFSWLSLSLGYFVSTAFVRAINGITKRLAPSRHGWLYGKDLNKNNLDLFYWFLAILSCLNFLVYLFCAKWYKYRKEGGQASRIDDGVERGNSARTATKEEEEEEATKNMQQVT
ncbi:protein NRT1/ PTR FAMILY 4.5-like [Phoenix dactylifera]|uniref:Protein NRT1/ PTR FAMILY 4.5-like n=1 Tax=Phoenix dactylifera TaxID=42345 RepID=A0A8B8ZPB9_PHODC|nr:protein NRT1/ PTR FAMILY 4.5-like [Phoenix dactylifera]